ncbi:MAG TPA: cupin domain-containing protein [Burkholderiales bacterium]
MAQPHATSGEAIDVRPLGERLNGAVSTALIKAKQLEIARLVLPAGKELPEHKTPGEVVVQCIEGRIEFRSYGKTQVLNSGDLIHLAAQAPHALKALENSSLLLTVCLSSD